MRTLGMMPLAQMNSTTAPGLGAPTAAPATPAPPTPAPAPVAPVGSHPVLEGPASQGAGVAPAAATQTATSQSGVAKDKEAIKPDSPFNWFGMPMLILLFIGLYFFMTRGQKKEEKRRKSLLSEMKKGDKVQTIGGLIARVVSIDNDEVVLKVDESANVKAVYKKSAILNVIVPADEKSK